MTSRTLRFSGRCRWLYVCLACLVFQTGALALATDQPDPFEAEKAAFMAAENDADRVAIGKQFIQDYPQHEQTGMVTGEVVYLLKEYLDDYSGAVALAESQLAAAGESDVKAEIQEILLELYGEPGYASKLQALVGQIYVMQDMSYMDHLNVLRAAAAAEAWSMVDKHVAAAQPLATSEAFRAAYPQEDFSDEFVADAGRNRQGLLKTFAGWSNANQGDTKKALVEFNAASAMVRKTFLGIPDNRLYLFWGQTLVMDGDMEKGLELLALVALFGTDHQADELVRQTYLDLEKNEAEYDDYLWQVRRKHDVKVVDFQAADYEGNMQTYNGLRGKKATLLAFWFPT